MECQLFSVVALHYNMIAPSTLAIVSYNQFQYIAETRI